MSRFKSFGVRARYNILTPAALLGVGLLSITAPVLAAADKTNPANTTIATVNIDDGFGFTNSGTVAGSTNGVTNAGAVTFINNTSTGKINGSTHGVDITTDPASVGTFTNAGSIWGGTEAVYIGGEVATFDNAATGTLTSDSAAVVFGGLVTAFTNEGQVQSYDSYGVDFENGVTTFGNAGSIVSSSSSSYETAVYISGASGDTPAVTSFTNTNTIWTGKGAAVFIDQGDGSSAAGSIANNGAVTGGYSGFNIFGDVGSFDNQAGGVIQATNSDVFTGDTNGAAQAVFIDGSITGTFSNEGNITATGSGHRFDGEAAVTTGVGITGTVKSFKNTGTIIANDSNISFNGESYGGIGVAIGDTTTSFENAGKIEGTDAGVFFGPFVSNRWDFPQGTIGSFSGKGHVVSFTNDAGATIQGDKGFGVGFADGVDTFVNNGNIFSAANGGAAEPGPGGIGVWVNGDVTHFTNTGNIAGESYGVDIYRGFSTFVNSGQISSNFSGKGISANFNGSAFSSATFVNTGTVTGYDGGADFDGEAVLDIQNQGTIQGSELSGVNSYGLLFNHGTLENSGTIKGKTGVIVVGNSDATTITNTGSIIGTDGPGITFQGDPTVITSGLISGSTVSIQFAGGVTNDLILQTGASFIGPVDFGGGATNTLDLTGFSGNMLFTYHLGGGDPTVTTSAGHLFVDDGAGNIAIMDDTAIRDAAQPVEDLVGGIQNSIDDMLSGGLLNVPGRTDSFVSNYASSKPKTPAASAAELMATPMAEQDLTVWGTSFGGGDGNASGAGTSTMFGGLLAGAQTELQKGFTLGGLVGLGGTHFAVAHGPQTVDATVGTVGVYGQAQLDTVSLDFSILAGAGANSSARTVSTPTGSDIATGSFGSWFIAPQVGVSLPVLNFDKGQVNIAADAGYIGGGFGGYTETGSVSNATVGAELISVFTAKAEVNGRMRMATVNGTDVTLTGKLGIFGDYNVGAANVPVSLLGLPTSGSSASGASGTGVYAGFGVDAPVWTNADLSANVVASVRSDGTFGAAGKAGVSGKF